MGQHWCFAHNGQLADFEPPKGIYRPVGDTDSERAFCDLLNRIRRISRTAAHRTTCCRFCLAPASNTAARESSTAC